MDAMLMNNATGALDRLDRLQAAALNLVSQNHAEDPLSFMDFVQQLALSDTGNWPENRQAELKTLQSLVTSARGLNDSTGLLTTLRQLKQQASELSRIDLDTGRPSFLQFLSAQVRTANPSPL